MENSSTKLDPEARTQGNIVGLHTFMISHSLRNVKSDDTGRGSPILRVISQKDQTEKGERGSGENVFLTQRNAG